MSLINPNLFEKAWSFVSTPSTARKYAVYAVLGVLLICGVLYGASKISTAWNTRKLDKLHQQVNAAVNDLQQVQTNIAVEKNNEKQALENVNIAVKDYANAANSTDAAKAETNRALNNMANAINANHNIGITAADLEKKLRELDE